MQKGSVKAPNHFERSLLLRKGYKVIDPAVSSGSFASVFRATHKGQMIAVKLIDCELNSDDYRYKFLPRELYVLKKLRHPFIATIYDIFTIGNRLFIFMELADGDAIDMLRDGALPEFKCQVLFKQVCTGLEYIHGLGIAHRDIKCENILLFRNQTVAKLTDFGFARMVYDQPTGIKILTQTHCGSAAYVAPEILEPGPVDAIRADCWSIGVVLFVLVNNRLPFTDKNIERQLRKQKKRQYFFAQELSNNCEDIISNLLEPDLKLRYNMGKVLLHPWLINVRIVVPNNHTIIN